MRPIRRGLSVFGVALTVLGVLELLLAGSRALGDQPVLSLKNRGQVTPARFDVHVNDLSDNRVPVVQPRSDGPASVGTCTLVDKALQAMGGQATSGALRAS